MIYELYTSTSLIELLTASYFDLWIKDDNSPLMEFMTASYYDLWIKDDNSFLYRVYDG